MITSPDNDRLVLVRNLHQRRWRDKLGLFVCEGEDLVEAAAAPPVDLLVAGENVEAGLLARVSSAPHPPRVVGVYRRDDLPAAEVRPLVLALWRLADPGNLGTLIRSADAFGAAVASSSGSADPDRPQGAAGLGRIDLPARAPTPFDPAAAGPGEAERRVALVVRGGRPLAELDLRGPVVFTASAPNARGCRRTRRARGREASIPTRGVESLNVRRRRRHRAVRVGAVPGKSRGLMASDRPHQHHPGQGPGAAASRVGRADGGRGREQPPLLPDLGRRPAVQRQGSRAPGLDRALATRRAGSF